MAVIWSLSEILATADFLYQDFRYTKLWAVVSIILKVDHKQIVDALFMMCLVKQIIEEPSRVRVLLGLDLGIKKQG